MDLLASQVLASDIAWSLLRVMGLGGSGFFRWHPTLTLVARSSDFYAGLGVTGFVGLC
ncbi:MAG: hypothetical protein ACJATP_002489 [Candidatus Azotimanducaceae bacterium]|jgi:hypothetical protein